MRSNARHAIPRGERARSWPEARCGFSLVEMVVVLMVVSIMAYIAIPRIEIVRFEMDGAIRGAMAALVSSQRLAVKRQHNVVIMFDTSPARLLIHQDRNNSGTVDANEPVRSVAFDDGVTFDRGGAPALSEQAGPITFTEVHDGLPAVQFIRNGSTSEEGVFYLTSIRASRSSGYSEDTRAIRVDRATGRVRWFAYRGTSRGWVEGT